MNIFITLDYELFFGSKTGTVSKCIIEPTKALLEIVEPLKIKITCFVDAGYLYALKRQMGEFNELKEDYDLIKAQLEYLISRGHRAELHVHPHWEDSFYDKDLGWVIDASRYKIDDFSEEDILDIFKRYTSEITEITREKPVVYRAGGWCVQPFSKIAQALKNEEIFLDSTVYPGGYYKSSYQSFNFRKVPQYKTQYKFSSEVVEVNPNGIFKEIPISSYRLSPLFFWKFVFVKLKKKNVHKAFGDGMAIKMNKSNILRLLFNFSYSVVSIDGFKASFLEKAFDRYKINTKNKGNFVIIGHPKAFSFYSLSVTKQFIQKFVEKHQFVTYDLRESLK